MSLVRQLIKLSLFIVTILFLLPFLYDIFDTQEDITNDKMLDIKNSQLIGYDKGIVTWKVFATNIWTKKNRYLFYADEILSGVVYDEEGNIIIDSLSAKNIKMNTKNNSFTISNGIEARVIIEEKVTKNGLIATETQTKKIKIKSTEMKYFSNNKRTYLNNDVELIKDDTVIKPFKNVEIDNNKNIAYIYQGFNLKNPEAILTGNQMIMYVDDSYSEFKGDLVFEKLPTSNTSETMDEKESELREENTFLYAEYATFYEEDTANELFVSENVVLTQPGKVLKADFAEYIEDLNLFKMNNNVVVELENLDWLLDKKIKEELTNDDIKSSLNDKTTLYANRLIFDSNAKETKLIGNVKIIQSDKTILCDKMVLYDETSLLECIGNVEVIKENQDSMFTEHLLIDLKDEIFTAKKGVYSEYHLQN